MKRMSSRPVLAAVVITAAVVAGSAAYATPRSAGTQDQAVIELKAPTPDWYTPELAKLVSEQGMAAAPADAPLPSGIGIRPGSWMISPYHCTMNFVFQNGSRLGIGTAGHCAKNGDDVVLITLAPGAGNPVLVNIGSTIVSHDAGIGNDFALVEIRPELHSWVFPTIAEIGGPCGTYSGEGLVSVQSPVDPIKGELIPSTFDLGDTVFHYGHGLGIGTGGTPRTGAALAWYPDSFTWASPSIGGDSGSPVRIQDLKAAGNLTHGLGIEVVPLGIVYGTRIDKILSMISSWSLVNSYAVGGSSPVLACPPGTPATSGGGSTSGGGGGGKGGNKRSR